MALEVRSLDSRLQIQLDLGQDGEGRKLTKTRTFSRLRAELSDEEVHQVASALIGLQSYPAIAIRRIDQSELVNL